MTIHKPFRLMCQGLLAHFVVFLYELEIFPNPHSLILQQKDLTSQGAKRCSYLRNNRALQILVRVFMKKQSKGF